MGCIIPWESDAKAPTSTTSGLKNSPSNVDLQEVVWRWCQAAGTDMDSLDGAEASQDQIRIIHGYNAKYWLASPICVYLIH